MKKITFWLMFIFILCKTAVTQSMSMPYNLYTYRSPLVDLKSELTSLTSYICFIIAAHVFALVFAHVT